MKINRCQLQGDVAPPLPPVGADPATETAWQAIHEFERSAPDIAALDEETAVEEAGACLGLVECRSCDLCRLLCPDLCVTRDEETGRIEIDYDFCKGCGICAAICPRGAIRMVAEEVIQ